MKRYRIFALVAALCFAGVALAADYDGDKKVDELSAHGGAVASTTKVLVPDPVDTDIITTATFQEIVTAVLGATHDTSTELDALYEGELNNSVGLAAALSDETGSGGGTPLAVFNYNPTITGMTMAGNIALGSNEIQSTGDVTIQLGDAAGTYDFVIQNSVGAEIFRIDSYGQTHGPAFADPYVFFDDNDMATEFAFRSIDTGTDHLAVGTTTDAMASNFTELGYFDVDKFYYDGNINISTGHVYQINGSQIALTNLSDGLSHASGHISAGADEIDGDQIDIDWNPTTYTPATTPSEVTSVDHLTAHLYGIDQYLAGIAAGTFSGLTDTNIATPASGHIPIYDGTDSWDNKAVSGHATLSNAGVVAVIDFALTTDADAGDYDITSIDQLQGVDAGLFVDMGADGILQLSSDGVYHFDIDAETLIMDSGANEIVFTTDTGVDTVTFTSMNIVGGTLSDGTVTLAGDGTITGLSAGGLPNETVDSDDYVDGSIDPEHLAAAGNYTSFTGNWATSGNLNGKTPAVSIGNCEGAHDGAENASTLSDSGESLTVDAYIGMMIYNITDGSSGLITDNDGTTITATLSGGTDNDWDSTDVWQVGPGPNQSGSVFYISAATTIAHPATAGYVAGYFAAAAQVIKIDPYSVSMTINFSDDGVFTDPGAGDEIDGDGTLGDFIWIHNASATEAYSHGVNGSWSDGGAS